MQTADSGAIWNRSLPSITDNKLSVSVKACNMFRTFTATQQQYVFESGRFKALGENEILEGGVATAQWRAM